MISYLGRRNTIFSQKISKNKKKSILISLNLFDEIHKEINLIIPDEINIKDCLKNERRLFFNYFSDDYEIWSEIESFSQVKKILQNQNNFPLRIIAASNEIENLKVKENSQKSKFINNKFDKKVQSFDVSIPLKVTFTKSRKIKNFTNLLKDIWKRH